MSGSALYRWQRAWISGAGVAFLGIGGFVFSGCTPFGNEPSSSTGRTKPQQVASGDSKTSNQGDSRPAVVQAKKKTVQRIVQNPPRKLAQPAAAQVADSKVGRVHISDEAKSKTIEAATTPRPANVSGTRPTRDAKPTLPGQSQIQMAGYRDDTSTPTADAKQGTKGSRSVNTAGNAKRKDKPPAASIKDGEIVAASTTRSSSDTVSDAIGKKVRGTAAADKNSKPAGESATGDVAEKSAAAPTDGGQTSLSPSPDRRRADVLMERAHAIYNSGYREEALRLASVAAEIEKSRKAVYNQGEERPSDFIAWMQTSDPGRAVVAASPQGNRAAGDQPGDNSAPAADGDISQAAVTVVARRPAKRFVRTGRTDTGSSLPVQASVDSPANAVLANTEVPLSSGEALAAEPENTSPDSESALALATDDIAPPPADEDADNRRTATSASETEAFLDSEPFGESELAGLEQYHPTQLTLIGIIGLITGLAGMIGLKWWQVQERRHYAGKAAPSPQA